MLRNEIIFAILLFSLSGLLIPPISFQTSSETPDFTLNDSIPSAYATSLSDIEKLAAYKIYLKIRVTEIPGEIEELEKNGPDTKPWYKTDARLKIEWEDKIKKLKLELSLAEPKLEFVCGLIDLYEDGSLGTAYLKQYLRDNVTLPQTINLAQSLTTIYLDMVQDILSGDLNIETFCKMLEFAIDTAEAVGDDETVDTLEEISEIAMAVKDAGGTVSDLKKALDDKDKAVGLGTSNISDDFGSEEYDDENLHTANSDNQSSIPEWIKSNAEWWSKGLISDSEFAAGLGYMVQSKIIQVDNVVIDTKGSVAVSDNISIPKWIRTNAEWWSSGAISDSDFKSGIQYMIQEEVISFEDRPQRQIDPPSLQLDAGPGVDPETSQLVFETAAQNLVSMTYLQKIKSAEYELIKNSYDLALNDYSKNKDQKTMNMMTGLGVAEKKAKEDSLRATQILKTAVQLAENAKSAAVKSGLSVLDLEKSVADQQLEIDSLPRHFETESEIKSAYKSAQKSQNKADEGLQDIFLIKMKTSSLYQILDINNKNSVSTMINGIEYSDFIISEPTKPSKSVKVWYVPSITVEIEDLSCTSVPTVDHPKVIPKIFANFIFGLKIPFAFGESEDYKKAGHYLDKSECPITAALVRDYYHLFGTGVLFGHIVFGEENEYADADGDGIPDNLIGLPGLEDDDLENDDTESVLPELEDDDLENDDTESVLPDLPPILSAGSIIFLAPDESGDVDVQVLSGDMFDENAEYYFIDITMPDGTTITVTYKVQDTFNNILDPEIIEGDKMINGDEDIEIPDDLIGLPGLEDEETDDTSSSGDSSASFNEPCTSCGTDDGPSEGETCDFCDEEYESYEETVSEPCTECGDDDGPSEDETCDTCDSEYVPSPPPEEYTGDNPCDLCDEELKDENGDLLCDKCGTDFNDGFTYNDDGSITTYYPDGTWTTTFPDGTSTTKFVDGSIKTSYPDGTSTEILPDGTVINRDSDGNVITGNTTNEKTTVTNADGTITTTYPDGTSVWLLNAGTKAIITYPDGSTEMALTGLTYTGWQVKLGTNTWNFNSSAEAYAAIPGIVDDYLSGKTTGPTGPYDPNQTHLLPLVTADYGRQYPAYQFTIYQHSAVCGGEAYYTTTNLAITLSLGSYASVGNCGYGTVNDYPIQNEYISGDMLNAYLNHLGLNAFPPVPEDTTGSYTGSSDPDPPSDSGLN